MQAVLLDSSILLRVLVKHEDAFQGPVDRLVTAYLENGLSGYDAAFVACAQINDAKLATSDRAIALAAPDATFDIRDMDL